MDEDVVFGSCWMQRVNDLLDWMSGPTPTVVFLHALQRGN